MLAAIEDQIESYSPVPFRSSHALDNLIGMVTLWDMLQVAAQNFVQTGKALEGLRVNWISKAAPGTSVDPNVQRTFVQHLTTLKQNCDVLGLVATSDLIGWSIGEYSATSHTWGQVSSTVEHLSVAFQQELARHFFAHIPQDKAKYMRSVDAGIANPPFGEKALGAFPHSLRDVALAGNCYACSFNDASVFHSMRVLEKGLEAMAKTFSVPFKFENWHNVIEQLESKIRKLDPTLGADWKEKQKFYSAAAIEFMFFKDAWRNHVMHGRDEYDDTTAENIYGHVCAFMRQLAEGGLAE